MKQNRKEIALSHLRARKQLEDILVKRSKALENLESTLWAVEQAAGDVEVTTHHASFFGIDVLTASSKIMKLYESSTATLRTILSHPSLQRDKVDETMDALHSATEDAKDVDLTIRLAGEVDQAAIIDDDEIEREFSALLRDEEREKLAVQERAVLDDTKRLEERLGEAKAPADVPGMLGEHKRATQLKEAVQT